MTINIKSINNKYLVLLLVVLFTACSHNENDGHKHDNKKETKEKPAGDACCATKFGAVKEESEGNEPAIASLTDEQIKTVGIQFGSIEQKQLTATLKANGALRVPNNNKANATSLYGGVIKTINVQVGSNVKSGQVIATITNPQFIQLQEEFLTVTSKIIYAEQELARQKELNDGNAGALKNYQSADAELKTLRTRKASLQEQIQLMGINPNSVSNSNLRSALVVKSPISGTISNVFSKIGSYVDVSSPVAEIVDNSQLHLDLNIFEKDLPLLKVGQVIHFTLTNNPVNEYDAKIYSIGTTFENDSKTIPIHCTVQGNKAGLIDGMNITAIVSLNNITTAAVPNEAIVDADGRSFIFIITDKKPDEHHDEEEGHKHSANEKHDEKKEKQPTINFERIEVIKGVSNVGYTAITTVNEIPKDVKIVTKGAFFVNAKLTNQGEAHEH
jgi:cobalt-zinc-cadmium efflux system membrane fusion protein